MIGAGESGLGESVCSVKIWDKYCDKIISLLPFYKPTTITFDDNIQQFSLSSTFAARPSYNSFNVHSFFTIYEFYFFEDYMLSMGHIRQFK